MTTIPQQRLEELVAGVTRTPSVTHGHPAWCARHLTNDADTHQSATWQGYGLSVVIEQDNEGTSLEVDKAGGSEYLSLTPEQAHELGMQLVRASDRVRRAVRA